MIIFCDEPSDAAIKIAATGQLHTGESQHRAACRPAGREAGNEVVPIGRNAAIA